MLNLSKKFFVAVISLAGISLVQLKWFLLKSSFQLCGVHGDRDIKMCHYEFRTIFKFFFQWVVWMNKLFKCYLLSGSHNKFKLLSLYFPQDLQSPNFVGRWIKARGSHLLKQITLWSFGRVMSHDKIETLYLNFYIPNV